LPSAKEVLEALENTLSRSIEQNIRIDTITFAGNGEPTLHPEFAQIIDGTITLRNNLFPAVKIAVLSNAMLIGKPVIREALQKVEYNILKLDSANEETIKLINCPIGHFSLPELIENLKNFNGNLTIQTLFVKGEYEGKSFDNSTDEEVQNWLSILKTIQPELVMIYTYRRDTPIDTIHKIPPERLKEIAMKVQALGIQVSVSA
jgi:wyosine [tRNA(Phe)-imidazoG37] synthetase (radical SAM superfamily)